MVLKCSKCLLEKVESDFYVRRGFPRGRGSHCKECAEKERRDLVKKNPERALRIKNYKKEYNKRPESIIKARESQRRRWHKPENKERNSAQSKRFREKYPLASMGWFLNKNYGLTVDDYQRMLDCQSGKCAICKRHYSEFKKRLHVDHDHSTGKVRSLLCHFCNTAIGSFNESVELMEEAIKYLKVHKL